MTRISSRAVLFLTAAVLTVAGVLSMVFLDSRGPRPELVCGKEGEPSSGFTNPAKGDCPITHESFTDLAQWQSSPNLFAIGGLLAVLIGVVLGIIGLVKTVRASKKTQA